MRVLVATEETQGARSDDYSWATPGELVMFGVVCASDLRGTGRGCGCGRAFAGLHSERATTTAEVADWPGSLDDLVLAFRDSLAKGGWLDFGGTPDEVQGVVAEAVMEVLLVADRYPMDRIGQRDRDARLAALATSADPRAPAGCALPDAVKFDGHFRPRDDFRLMHWSVLAWYGSPPRHLCPSA